MTRSGVPIDAETKIWLAMIESTAKFFMPQLKHIKNKTERKIAAGFMAHRLLADMCERIGEDRMKELWRFAIDSPLPDAEVEALISEALGLAAEKAE